jgi:hypothetical protein
MVRRKMKERCDKTANKVTYKVGDICYLKVKKFEKHRHKLGKRFLGPFVVHKLHTVSTVFIKDLATNKIKPKAEHITRLKKGIVRPKDLQLTKTYPKRKKIRLVVPDTPLEAPKSLDLGQEKDLHPIQGILRAANQDDELFLEIKFSDSTIAWLPYHKLSSDIQQFYQDLVSAGTLAITERPRLRTRTHFNYDE